jgi:hypothetical protein
MHGIGAEALGSADALHSARSWGAAGSVFAQQLHAPASWRAGSFMCLSLLLTLVMGACCAHPLPSSAFCHKSTTFTDSSTPDCISLAVMCCGVVVLCCVACASLANRVPAFRSQCTSASVATAMSASGSSTIGTAWGPVAPCSLTCAHGSMRLKEAMPVSTRVC